MKVSIIALISFAALAAFLTAYNGTDGDPTATAQTDKHAPKEAIPLKDAKLNIEHNATDNDTGFQGFVDSEGWKRLNVTGPDGTVLSFAGRGKLATLGLTELFFETVEPANVDVPIKDMLSKLPAGDYTIAGPSMENGESSGKTAGTAWLTHNIPAGPELLSPAAGATVPATALVARWGAEIGRASCRERV